MATGPEHYAEAERLLARRIVEAIPSGTPYEAPPTTDMVLQALVHATLALAAATWANEPDPNGSGQSVRNFRAWDEVCGVRRDEG